VHYYPAHVSVVKANESMVSTMKEKNNATMMLDHYLESSGSSGSMELDGIHAILDATTYIDENDDDVPCFRVGDLFFFLGSMLDVSKGLFV
jgi:hypothetical protein